MEEALTRRVQEHAQAIAERDRLFTLSLDLLCIAGFDGYFKQLNPAWEKTLGFTIEELQAKPGIEFVHPEDRERTRAVAQKLWPSGEKDIISFENRYRCKDGSYKWILWTATASMEERLIYAVGSDITERKRAEEALQFTQFSVDRTADAVCWVAPDARFLYVNEAACQMFGYPCEELLSMTVHDIDPNYPAEVWPQFWREIKRRGSFTFETCARTGEGETLPVEVTANYLEFDGKEYMCAFARDVSERRRAEEALEARAHQQAVVAELGQRALAGTHPSVLMDRAVALIAKALDVEYCKVLQLLPGGKALLLRAGVGWKEGHVGHAKVGAKADSQAGYTLISKKPVVVEDLRREKRFRGPPLLHDHGVVSGMSVIIHGKGRPYGVLGAHTTRRRAFTEYDVHFLQAVANVLATAIERKRAEETITHQAYHDALTDLPNRMLLKEHLTLTLAQARRREQLLALMFLDLDRFELINDAVGHDAGDQLLKSVAEGLTGLVGEGDTVARVGGDEFALVLQGAGVEEAVKTAQRVFGALWQPWMLADQEFHMTASIGIAVYPNDGTDAETLLKNADTAMHRAKEQGGGRYQLYAPAMNAEITERLALETDLRRALERREFAVYFQPQVNVSSGQIVGVEALVRWEHPSQDLIFPAQFIPVAEETGLIVPIGEWVLRTACAQNKAWQEAGFPPMRVAVNLSARQFQQKDLVERVAQVLKETGLAPHYLQLEITEGTAMQDVEFTIKTLSSLRELDVGIAIDDFGTGYSSLNYLRRLPINAVKIDRSFVHNIALDPDDTPIVTLIIVLAQSLKLKVIAEGVETEEQLAFLKQRQCDEMQGYLFSEPVRAKTLEKMMTQEMRANGRRAGRNKKRRETASPG
ncbi:MAG: EAL domain-containing protein [Dehalococcoidia bacterium]